MDRFCIAVLSVLNQKYHQERDDGRCGVDDQLPRIGEMKHRPGQEPNEDDKHSSSKCPGAPEHHRGTAGENTERIANYAKEIVFFLALS